MSGSKVEASGRGTEFEVVQGPGDFKVSKSFRTSDGDELRAVYVGAESVIVSRVGERGQALDSITVHFPPGTPPPSIGLIKEIWEKGKQLLEKGFGGLMDAISGQGMFAGNCNPIIIVNGSAYGGSSYGGGNIDVDVHCNQQQ
jgi:hypothetical protein